MYYVIVYFYVILIIILKYCLLIFLVWYDFFNVILINSEELFVKYSVYYSVRRFLWNRGWVIIIGFFGDGKRVLVEYLMVKFVRKLEKFL